MTDDKVREEFEAYWIEHPMGTVRHAFDAGYQARAARDAERLAALEKQLAAAQADYEKLRKAVQANHRWHEEYDLYGCYDDSELFHTNTLALSQSPDTSALDAYVAEKTAALQAKVDALMLEYCPDEMTPEQRKNWGQHQVPLRASAQAHVDGSFRIDVNQKWETSTPPEQGE